MRGAAEPTHMSVLSRLIQSLIDAPEMFLDVAAQGPIQAILVVFGALFVGVAVLVFGLLALAAIVKLFTPSSSPVRRRPAE
jgi:hypothetical protein